MWFILENNTIVNSKVVVQVVIDFNQQTAEHYGSDGSQLQVLGRLDPHGPSFPDLLNFTSQWLDMGNGRRLSPPQLTKVQYHTGKTLTATIYLDNVHPLETVSNPNALAEIQNKCQ